MSLGVQCRDYSEKGRTGSSLDPQNSIRRNDVFKDILQTTIKNLGVVTVL